MFKFYSFLVILFIANTVFAHTPTAIKYSDISNAIGDITYEFEAVPNVSGIGAVLYY